MAVPDGYLYCGAPGSGHFAKMIHNGIEYGMMQSIAEGFELMHQSEYEFRQCSCCKIMEQWLCDKGLVDGTDRKCIFKRWITLKN